MEEILLLQNMPREHVGAELARELGRAFLYLAEEQPATDSLTEQGFAELCCYLWVRAELQALETSRAHCREQLKALHDAREVRKAERATILADVERARRERVQANEAEAFARKQLAEAKEARLFGWPGAERKMEVARLAAAAAERVLIEAVECESHVTGARLPQVDEELARISVQEAAMNRQAERDEQLTAAYGIYLLTMENNPHPVLGAGLRAALAGFDAVGGNMRLFVSALLSTGKFAEPRRKTAEELRIEAAEAENLRRALQDAEDTERNRLSQERISALRARLADAPRGAPGPPPELLAGGSAVSVGESAQPVESDGSLDVLDDAIIDELQDRFHRSEPGSMDAAALVEYFSHKIRGEHSQPYCCELGEGHLRTVNSLRAHGDLDGALLFCSKAETAFTHAGAEGEKKMWTVTSLKNSILREQSQLQTAISFQRKAENAVQSGILFDGFRKFYKEAVNLYKGCGIAANQDDRLPALERLYAAVLLQEEHFRAMSQALEVAKNSFAENKLDEACPMIAEAVNMIERTGVAGQELGAKAVHLQKDIMTSLVQKARQAELSARSALDVFTPQTLETRPPKSLSNLIHEDMLQAAESNVSQIRLMFLLSAIANGEVHLDSSEEHKTQSQEKYAQLYKVNIHHLTCEIKGCWEQRKAFDILTENELCTWPANKPELLLHIQRAKIALSHLSRARSFFLEAGNFESKLKLQTLTFVEIDLSLRTGANEMLKPLIDSSESIGKRGCDERMPFVCVAAALDNADGLQILLSRGGDINARDQYGNSPLHLAVIFNASISLKCICACKNLSPNLSNNFGYTPLICSVTSTKKEITGKTVLWCMMNSQPIMLFNRIDGSCGPNQQETSTGASGKSITQILLELPKLDPNIVSLFDGETALIVACEENNEAAIECLLQDSRILPNISDFRGRTALITSICKHKPIALLLQNPKVDPNAVDPLTGHTPLYYAITRWNMDAFSQLLAHDSVHVTGVDYQGWSPIHALEFEDDPLASDVIANTNASIRDTGSTLDARRIPICRWWIARAADVAYLNIGALQLSSSDTFLHVLNALTDAKYWGLLCGFLTHIWVLVSAIMHLGIDTVYSAVKASADIAHKYSGVSKTFLAEIDALVEILRMCCESQDKSDYKCMSDELFAFINSLKQNGRPFCQRIQLFALKLLHQSHTDSKSNASLDMFPNHMRRFMWLSQIKRFNFDSLLMRPHLVSCAIRKIQYYVQRSVQAHGLQNCLESLHTKDILQKETESLFRTQNSNQVIVERVATFLDSVPHESAVLNFVFDCKWDIFDITTNMQLFCQFIRAEFLAKGCPDIQARAIRYFQHNGLVYVTVSVTVHSFSSCALAPNSTIVQSILHSLKESACHESLNELLKDIKIICAEKAQQSIFLFLQLVLPSCISMQFKSRAAFELQMLHEIASSFESKDDIRIERISESFDSVVIEFLPNQNDNLRLLTKKKVRRLVQQLNRKGTNPWKGQITSHVISATFTQDLAPPGFPDEWLQAQIVVLEMSGGIDDEKKYLESCIKPALQLYCMKFQCLLNWNFINCRSDTRIIFNTLSEMRVKDSGSSILPINIVIALCAELPANFEAIDPVFIREVEKQFPWSKGSENERSSYDILMNSFLLYPGIQKFVFTRNNFAVDDGHASQPPEIVQRIFGLLQFNKKIHESAARQFDVDIQNKYTAKYVACEFNHDFISNKLEDLDIQIDVHKEAINSESQLWKRLNTSTNGFLMQARISQLEEYICSLNQKKWCLNKISKSVLDADWLKNMKSDEIESKTIKIDQDHKNINMTRKERSLDDENNARELDEHLYQGLRFDVRYPMFQIALSLAVTFCQLPQIPASRSVCSRHFQLRGYQYFLMREYSSRSIWIDGEPRSILIQNMTQIFDFAQFDISSIIFLLQGPNYSGRTTVLAKVISDSPLYGNPGNCEPFDRLAVVFYFRVNEPLSDVLQYIAKEIAFQVRGGAEWTPEGPTSQILASMNELRSEILHALSVGFRLVIALDSIDGADQIILSKEVMDCLKEHSSSDAGRIRLLFSTENSKLFKYNSLQAGLIGEQKDVFKVFMIRGLTKIEQLALWSHFLERCQTRDMHDSEAVFKTSKQDLESPLYLLLLALLPLISKSITTDSIAQQVDALSGKVAQLWKHDIMPRIAFSIGLGVDSVAQAINILLSHCGGLRRDGFIKMAVHLDGRMQGKVNSQQQFELLCRTMASILRPWAHPGQPVAMEHVHLHISSTHETELKRLSSHISSPRTSVRDAVHVSFNALGAPWNELRDRIEIARIHHEDLFVRCVIQPFMDNMETGNLLNYPCLEKNALLHCHTTCFFAIDLEFKGMLQMQNAPTFELLDKVNSIVVLWSKTLTDFLDSCDAASLLILEDDLDGRYSSAFLGLEKVNKTLHFDRSVAICRTNVYVLAKLWPAF